MIDAELAPASGMIEKLREQKDDGEIAIIEKACAIADEGFEHVLKMIRPGMTEIEVANQLDFFMRSLGATAHRLIRLWLAVFVLLCHMALPAKK